MSRWRRRPDPTKARAVKARLPRCGAKCRNGQPCRNPGTGAGGRCPKHGGLTPSGDQWHVARLPRDDGPRYDRKIATLAKRRAKRAAEIAAMSPGRRARYDEWCRTHKPGRRSDRERARRDREAREILSRPRPTQANPELAALEAELAEVRASCAKLEALLAGQDPEEGVFG
jgi:hypothetical protein